MIFCKQGFLGCALAVLIVLCPGVSGWRAGAELRTFEGAVAPGVLPFRRGESLVYELRWGIIPAGLAELAVLPTVDLDGVPAYHFRLSVRTNEYVDIFYKVRDKIEAHAAQSLQESFLYHKSQQEGHSVRDEVVRFDNDRNLAIYSNHGEVAPAIRLMTGSIDPLTAVFFIRSQPLREGLEITRPITDGKKNVTGVARVLGREKLAVNGVEYDTFRIEPDLRGVGGVFEKSAKSRVTLWYTTDARHLLVKVAGKVLVGSFTGTLLTQTGGAKPSWD